MDKLEEKIESLEQVIEALIGRFRNVEIVVGSLAEQEPKDYSQALASITKLLTSSQEKASLEAFKSSLDQLHERMRSHSNKSETRHYHHLDLKSRSRLWWFLAVFVIVSASLGTSVSLLTRNHRLFTDAEKYRVVRAFYPLQTKEVDRAYGRNRKGLLAVCDSLLLIPEPTKVKKKK